MHLRACRLLNIYVIQFGILQVLLYLCMGFPGGSAGKESSCNAGDLGLMPGLGRSSGEGKGYPLQYSGLENSMDWIVHGVPKSRTRLSDVHLPLCSLLPIFADEDWKSEMISFCLCTTVI